METFDLDNYDPTAHDLTSYDVYVSTPSANRRIAAFSSRADAIDFAKVAAYRTIDNATSRVVVVARDSRVVIATFS